MADVKYTYSIQDDFPNQKVAADRLEQQIHDSSIVTALAYISTSPYDCDIYFKADLSVDDKVTLDTIVANHDGTPLPDVATVHLDVATIEDPSRDVQRVAVQPGRTGYYMCDRDIRVKTAMVSDAFEDLKVNISDNKQTEWGEFSSVGCYKLVGADYVACDDQDDADVNAVLSVYDYIAVNQDSNGPIGYDFKGGCLWSDYNLVEPHWEHRMYAVMAPNIPSAYGGSVRFFDGYLYPYQGTWQECINSLALKIDPSQTVEAARMRFWIYYPAGAKQNHVLRIVTFRKPETF